MLNYTPEFMKSQALNIQQNIPLAPFTTFKIGGPAKFFCEVKNEEELLEALNYSKKNNLEIFVLGGGSNVLVSDEGFDGLVVKLVTRNVKRETRNTELSIECWAGDSLASAVRFSAENSLTGLEWAAGIPGSVGGAIRGNAGAFRGEMKDCLEEIRVLDIQENEIRVLKKEDCQFSYRSSIFKQNPNLIILSCVIKLDKGDKAEIENKISEIIKKRTEKQPQGMGSAGSTFMNPVVENQELIKRFEKDTGLVCKDCKIPAGWIIAEAGLSGKKMGQIQVSEKHANFVVNLGGGKASDVVMLTSYIKQQVRDQFGVDLKEETKYVGF
jgi:UDP-N-acetylmuramate dehydrogenase